jgi:hypothetical protein
MAGISGGSPIRRTKMKAVLKTLALVFLAAAFTGCAALEQYSIDSYQGILPVEDHVYVTADY